MIKYSNAVDLLTEVGNAVDLLTDLLLMRQFNSIACNTAYNLMALKQHSVSSYLSVLDIWHSSKN